MNIFINNEFVTSLKVNADIHAGGCFFWTTYYDKLIFKKNNCVELVRIYENSNGGKLQKEELLFRGVYEKPKIGHYDIEIELKHITHQISISYCGKMVDDNKLICYCVIKSAYVDTHSCESEIFTKL